MTTCTWLTHDRMKKKNEKKNTSKAIDRMQIFTWHDRQFHLVLEGRRGCAQTPTRCHVELTQLPVKPVNRGGRRVATAVSRASTAEWCHTNIIRMFWWSPYINLKQFQGDITQTRIPNTVLMKTTHPLNVQGNLELWFVAAPLMELQLFQLLPARCSTGGQTDHLWHPTVNLEQSSTINS